MSKQLATILLALLLAAGVGAAVGAGVALQTESDSSSAADSTTPVAGESVADTTSSTAALYKRVKDAVVEIHASQSGSDAFGNERQGEATGSGFVIDEQGHIVTNQHVVGGSAAARSR